MKTLYFSKVLFVISILLASCSNDASSKDGSEKTPDQQMTEQLVGTYFKDDEQDEEGTYIKDYTIEYFKDGKFQLKVSKEGYDEYSEEYLTEKYNFMGNWKIEKGYLKQVVLSLTTVPDYSKEYCNSIVEQINKENTADKIIEINEQRFVYDNAEGERNILKRRVQ